MNPNKTKDFDWRQADSVIYQRSRVGTTLDNAPEMSRTLIFLLTMLANLWAQDRTVDPTWLHRYLPELNETHAGLSSATCHYKPVFGADENEHQIFRSVSRFG